MKNSNKDDVEPCAQKKMKGSHSLKKQRVCKINFIVLNQERNFLSSFSFYWTTDVDEQISKTKLQHIPGTPLL